MDFTRATRQVVVAIMLVVLCLCLGVVYWNYEIQYAKPTNIPVGYRAVLPGEQVSLPAAFQKNTAHFLHFYNPDCPCSRFNAQHIQSLIRSYGDSIRFVIVIPASEDLARARDEFGSDLDYVVDTDGAIAAACGVYATPQAAIIQTNGSLYYRGNYNAARYCTQRATNFAELSLLSLLNGQPAPVFGLLATQSYGCELQEDAIPDFF
jgi:hypothetical protein